MVRALGPFTGPTLQSSAQNPSMPLQQNQGFRGLERRLQPVVADVPVHENLDSVATA